MVGRHAEQGRPKARCAVEESFVRRMALGTLWTSRKSSVAKALSYRRGPLVDHAGRRTVCVVSLEFLTHRGRLGSIGTCTVVTGMHLGGALRASTSCRPALGAHPRRWLARRKDSARDTRVLGARASAGTRVACACALLVCYKTLYYRLRGSRLSLTVYIQAHRHTAVIVNRIRAAVTG